MQMIGAGLDQMMVAVLVIATICIGLVGIAVVINSAEKDEDDYTL